MSQTISLPQALDMERATLGAVLLNRDAMAHAAALLPSADHFHDQRHEHIWTAMLACFESRTPPDLKLVANELRMAGRLDSIGGMPFLLGLADHAPSSFHVGYYAQQVAAAAARRRAIAAGGAIAAMGYDEAIPLAELHGQAQAALDVALVGLAKRGGAMLGEIALDAFESYRAQAAPGVCTGYRDLDEILGGLQRSDLLLLAARPGVGKTALAMGIAEQVARDDRHVQMFSLEMSRAQLFDRMVAGVTGINTQVLRLRRVRDADQLSTVTAAMGDLARLKLRVEDDAALTIGEVRSLALREASVNGPLDLIVIDYLQLMTGSGKRSENRVQEVGEISRGLKQLARELDVPILALSQLSRNVEGRTSHVPMLSDLRESGSLEQDADVVMFIYREEMYDKETDKKGVAEIHIAKHRNGPTGVVSMRFDSSTTKFSDLSYRQPEGY